MIKVKLTDQNQGKIEGILPKSQERRHNNPIYNNTWRHTHSMLNHLYPLFISVYYSKKNQMRNK